MENMLSYNQYLVEAVDAELDIENEEGIVDPLEFTEEEIYEALRRTKKQEEVGNEIRELMNELNKRDRYVSAKDKFLKVFNAESKQVIREKGLHPGKIKQMKKVKLSLGEL